MTLANMLQNAVIADFGNDTTLNQYPIRPRDYGKRKAGEDIYPNSADQSLVVITVGVTNQGEFKYGSAIYRMLVEVQVIYNGAADNFDGQLIDTVADAVGDRMQPSNNLGVDGREQIFSNSTIKVYGIMADQPSRHEVSGFQRIRTVSRTFVIAQVAGGVL